MVMHQQILSQQIYLTLKLMQQRLDLQLSFHSSKGYILRYKTKITNPSAKPHKNTVKLEGKNIKTEEKVGQVFVSGGGEPVQVTIIHLVLKKYS